MHYWKTPLGRLVIQLIIGLLAGIFLIKVFAEMAQGVLMNSLMNFDNVWGDFIRSFSDTRVTRSIIFVTDLGSATIEIPLFLMAAAYLAFRIKHTWETVILAVALAGGWLLNEALKAAFHRSRPGIKHLVEAGGYSFPSGHAMVSAAFYGMLGYIIWLNLKERTTYAWVILLLTAVLITAIGISRIYLGVHFPSDVIAGFAAGGAWLAACITALNGIRYYKGKRVHDGNEGT
ncbi:phosphatase PAP2 family protein [Metallumcola ferriviriculae]|uniref:Phosphatase PAP2 family protein n=1 Tax=Metallumcola ferriviriculae TaxID=3039180 RepID=A0AAU0UTD8_9FIRM|nr:phosphatase PAP2 family protein [Desulfitibacteraceae bacterium MK1]